MTVALTVAAIALLALAMPSLEFTWREAPYFSNLAILGLLGAVTFVVPPAPQGRPWRRAVDTALASPLDVVGLDEGPVVHTYSEYVLAPFSLLVLIAQG